MPDDYLLSLPYGSARPGTPPEIENRYKYAIPMNYYKDPTTGTEALPARPRERKVDKIYRRWCCGSCWGIVAWIVVVVVLLIAAFVAIIVRVEQNHSASVKAATIMQEPVSASTSTSTVGSTTTTILPSTIATITIPSTIVYSVITITLTATPTLPPPSTITTVTIATTTVTSTSTSTSTYTPPLPSVSTVTYTPPTPSTSTLSATSTLTLHLLSSPTTTITRTVPATAASNQESAFVGVESGGVAGSVSATPGPTGMITGIGAAAPPELTTSRFTDTGFSRGPPLTTAPGLRSNSVGGVISQASASSSSATPPPQSSASSTGPQSEIVGCINANNPRCVNAKITLRDLLERTLTTTSYTAITAVETAYSTLPYSFTTITMSASPDPEVAANQIVVSTSTSTMTTTATVTTVTIVTYTPPTASIMTVTAREVASTAMLQPPSRVRNRFKQGPQL